MSACVQPMEKLVNHGPKKSAAFLPTNQGPANILVMTGLHSGSFDVFQTLVWFHVFRSQGFQSLRFPDYQIFRVPDSQISRLADSKIPRLSDFQTLGPHPGTKYVTRSQEPLPFQKMREAVSAIRLGEYLLLCQAIAVTRYLHSIKQLRLHFAVAHCTCTANKLKSA